MEDNPEGASCLGPLAGLEKQREQYSAAVDVLANPSQTRLILVARAQTATLIEVSRTHQELADLGIKEQFLAINGKLPASEAQDPVGESIYQREQQALASMPANLAQLPRTELSLKPFNLVGINALEQLLSDSTDTSQETDISVEPPSLPPLSTLVDELAQSGKGLIMLMGKGGGRENHSGLRPCSGTGQARPPSSPDHFRPCRPSSRDAAR